MSEPQLEIDQYCFACGRENPIGLRVTPQVDDGICRIHWTPRREHQGYKGILHGGITTSLLDEAMAYACLSEVGSCATAQMQTKFSLPVLTALPLEIEARVVERKRRLLRAEATLRQEGAVKATATATFVRVRRA